MKTTSTLELIENILENEQNQLFKLVDEAEKLSKLMESTMESISQKQKIITMLEKLKALSKA